MAHVLGARPNFVKAAPVIAALSETGREQRVIHTGQHYDERMSEVFFRDLGLPEPDVNLEVGSGSHAAQTAAIMVALEKEFIERSPELVMVYGDVNSTIAAALVAAKLRIPVAHVEAGLRSFDMTMPEEVNRRLVDQLSDLCLVTSPEAVGHLAAEGVAVDRIHFVGNPMIDTLLANLGRFDADAVRRAYDLPERYVVATLHRPANVDDPEVAAGLVKRLHEIAELVDVVMPVHPRGRKVLTEAGLDAHPRVRLLEPLGYVEFVAAVRGAAAVVTDSGGVQEETTILGVPCLTLRPNTERPITITHGTNRLVTADDVVPAVAEALAAGRGEREHPPLWDGHAGPRIARVVEGWLGG
ncbi:non-hydrolyzing UDP-N-acetylglucosamine 2-epimerase [Actinoallomurus rhizosphaericola]|uniref:non-hydrolyzing UDP-N-acetylglucosamine 2-epimerase n=1 Tax=Actinoallomurus rhizosphaericola TaxID=2952536 RepID=UPI002092D0B3|nr:UDP-N-acetylglucosamine 2-epimerase (non-hydrolyzing) [Actinoallomurus rhizosphaericola]MCO5998700.1 UDP-N-acetylglucosamine 2-epimerase (non-hydrolyzing) [Actinoallomurus rhizosphaericola]